MVKESKKDKGKKNNVTNKDFVFAVGRRKESVARVRLYKKNNVVIKGSVINKGDIIVNHKKAEEYFGKSEANSYKAPLLVTNTEKDFAISIVVKGGGMSGQLGATVIGIARALDSIDRDQFRPLLKKKGFLTRDPRVRERRKVGMGGKARRKKQSPKR